MLFYCEIESVLVKGNGVDQHVDMVAIVIDLSHTNSEFSRGALKPGNERWPDFLGNDSATIFRQKDQMDM